MRWSPTFLGLRTFDHIRKITVSENPLDSICCLASCPNGVWISLVGKTSLQLWSTSTFEPTCYCDISKYVSSRSPEVGSRSLSLMRIFLSWKWQDRFELHCLPVPSNCHITNSLYSFRTRSHWKAKIRIEWLRYWRMIRISSLALVRVLFASTRRLSGKIQLYRRVSCVSKRDAVDTQIYLRAYSLLGGGR